MIEESCLTNPHGNNLRAIFSECINIIESKDMSEIVLSSFFRKKISSEILHDLLEFTQLESNRAESWIFVCKLQCPWVLLYTI